MGIRIHVLHDYEAATFLTTMSTLGNCKTTSALSVRVLCLDDKPCHTGLDQANKTVVQLRLAICACVFAFAVSMVFCVACVALTA